MCEVMNNIGDEFMSWARGAVIATGILSMTAGLAYTYKYVEGLGEAREDLVEANKKLRVENNRLKARFVSVAPEGLFSEIRHIAHKHADAVERYVYEYEGGETYLGVMSVLNTRDVYEGDYEILEALKRVDAANVLIAYKDRADRGRPNHLGLYINRPSGAYDGVLYLDVLNGDVLKQFARLLENGFDPKDSSMMFYERGLNGLNTTPFIYKDDEQDVTIGPG